VLVPFDPRSATGDEVSAIVRPLLPAGPDASAEAPDDALIRRAPRDQVVRVRYGGADGPDLEATASELGLTPADVVALHAGTPYEVLFLGFAPGFAYLGELPEALVVPRLATPRTHVPAGSVAIADAMTAVYPRPSPGGWRLLGRTDVVLFDASAVPPSRLQPGDRVRFEPV
jgi:KipI family sensor histidine kinase inhibitor